jgi:hypothetical protein
MNNSGILPILRGKKLDTDLVEMVSERKESRFCHLMHRHLQLLPGALKCLDQLHERGSSRPLPLRQLTPSSKLRL